MARALAKVAVARGRPPLQDLDREIAARIRQCRIMLGLTQTELGDRIGVGYQQVQKYERSTNRLSVGQLYRIAQALGVEVSYLFQGTGEPNSAEPTDRQRAMLELARNFAHLPSQAQQAAFCELARALSTAPPPLPPDLNLNGNAPSER